MTKMNKTFKQFYEATDGYEVVKTKKTKLNVEDVTIMLKNNEGVAAQIEIMLNRDPNITGFVKYENLEKAKMAFKHLTKLGPILNFMYYNMTNNDTAFKWSHIVNIEVSAEKKKTKEEIEKDGINFSIKSDMEREAELQAAMMGAEMGEEPPGEVPPQLQKENDKLI
jgi:hypothetical protein